MCVLASAYTHQAHSQVFAYVPNYDSNTVSVINTSTNTVVGLPIAVGTNPVGVAVRPDGTKVYVTNKYSNTVSVIDATTNTVTATISVGRPSGVAVSPDGTKVYVANLDTNTVSIIDASTNTVTATISVGHLPVALGNMMPIKYRLNALKK